jgi:hypothetical protein
MNSGISAGFFYPFAKPAKHFLAVNTFAPVEAVNALPQLRFQFGELEKIQPKLFGDDPDLVVMEPLVLRGKSARGLAHSRTLAR